MSDTRHRSGRAIRDRGAHVVGLFSACDARVGMGAHHGFEGCAPFDCGWTRLG